MGSPPRWLSGWAQVARLGLIFTLLILGPMLLGWCGCTMFAVASAAWLLACAMLVGTTGFAALTSEREKKTLDSLRLTQLTSSQILLAKLRPEFSLLGRLAAAMAPAVLVAGALGGYGWMAGLMVVLLGLTTGVFSSVLAICTSSLFDTTSRAVVAGWVGKALWLLLTPLADTILAAVLVLRTPPPIFSSLNPLAALKVLLLPEAVSQGYGVLPFMGLLSMLGVAGAMFVFAARRFDNGLAASGGVYDRHQHPVYRQGWGPAWVRKALGSNPSFLREMAFQLRSGAGRWPGYAVFLVLFLAPFLYAQSWSAADAVRRAEAPVPVVETIETSSNPVAITAPGDPVAPRQVRLRTRYGETLILPGHTNKCCMRVHLNRVAHVPLPANTRRVITEMAYSYDSSPAPERVETTEPFQTTPIDYSNDNSYGYYSSQVERASHVRDRSLSLGLAGSVMLLLLYLAIRCSGFLATAVTGERDRRSWEDLALTGISVDTVLSGKVAGALALPLTQMTLCFPALLFFVYTGNLTVAEVLGLFVFATALAVTAALTGLFASASSASSHEAHARCLAMVVGGFALLPALMGAGSALISLVAFGCAFVVLSQRGRFTEAAAWVGVATSLLVNAQAASPLTSALSFLPSLLATRVSFIQSLGAGVTGLSLINWMAAVLFLVSVSYLLWSASLRRLGVNDNEPGALRAELAH
ncbi:MAG: hypothetical protein AB7S38_25590 [Vulcanimicrobiota bacterium]